MSTVLTAQEPSAKYLVNLQPPLVQHFDLIAQAPGGVARLRELILTLAVQGKLVPQDPSDEPASVLLQKIRVEKDRLIAEGKIKRDKPLAEIADEEKPFELPLGWEWVRIAEVASPQAGFAFKSSAFNDLQQGLPLIRIRDVGENKPVTYYSGDYRTEFIVEPGDWLVSMDGEFRVRQWSGPSALLNQRVSRLIFYGSDLFQPFVTAALQFKLSELQGVKAYTTVDHLSGGQIASSVIALPPLAEQSRIVTRVEELMQLCDALEASGQLEAQQHAQLVATLLGTLTQSETPEALADNWQRIATHFDLLLDRPEAVDTLEQTILQLAVRGLLVPQDPTDEPASVLLQKIRAEKDHLIAQGKIKRDKPVPPITDEEKPFQLPQGWEWTHLGALMELISGQHLGPNEYVDGLEGGIPYLTGPAEFGAESPSPTRSTKEMRAVASSGDILITVKGSGVGKLNVVRHQEMAISRQLMAIRPVGVNFDFVLLVLKTMALKFQAQAVGIAIPGIGRDDVAGSLVALPPLAEQARIVTSINELRALCADLRQSLIAAQSTQGHLADALIAG